VQPLVPGYTITGELSSSASGSRWSAVRSHDERRLVVKIVGVSDMAQALVQAAGVMDVVERINNEHLVRQRDVIALADNTLALVLDEVAGERLVDVLGSRSRLTPGETVTTVAPLFGALADLHSVGVVHGDLTPEQVLFSADGKPLICDLGVARLRGRQTGPVDRASRFVAPELVGDAAPSTASDVYAMAAIGWVCLTGAPPPPGAPRKIVTGVTAETPPGWFRCLPRASPPTRRRGRPQATSQPVSSTLRQQSRSGWDRSLTLHRTSRGAFVLPPCLPPP
jgi:serine/threonine protein kinase